MSRPPLSSLTFDPIVFVSPPSLPPFRFFLSRPRSPILHLLPPATSLRALAPASHNLSSQQPMFAPRRPDAAAAAKELKTNVLLFAAFCGAVRAAPFVLHALSNRK